MSLLNYFSKNKQVICLAIVTVLFTSNICNIKSNQQAVCSKYACPAAKETEGCAKRTGENSFNLFKCEDTEKICPYLETSWNFDTKEGTEVKCTDRLKSEGRNYPGGYCQKNDDCIEGSKCDTIANKCKRPEKFEDNKCQSNSDCLIGETCSGFIGSKVEGKKCYKQDVLNNCQDSFDCPNTHGCFTTGIDTGKCIPYFSVEDGEKAPPKPELSFCKSGFATTLPEQYRDDNEYCRSIKLVNELPEGTPQECKLDDDCVYEYQYKPKDGEEITIKQSFKNRCKCGYNKEGKSYCRPGIMEIENYESYKKNIIHNLKHTECHTEERFNCNFINDYQNYRNQAIKKFETEDLYKLDFLNSDDCVMHIVNPGYNKNFKMPQCPKFECLETPVVGDTCASSPGNSGGIYNISVSKCTNGTCNYDINKFFSGDKYTAECKPEVVRTNNFYPGEVCKESTDCNSVNFFNAEGVSEKKAGECVEVEEKPSQNIFAAKSNYLNDEPVEKVKKCKGNKAGARCIIHEDCELGNYCADEVTKPSSFRQLEDVKRTCKPLIKYGEACENTHSCENNLLCHKSKCIDAFSVKIGEDISDIEQEFLDYACETNYHYNNKCAKIKYTKKDDDFNAKINKESGLVECTFDENCYYDVYYVEDKDKKDVDLESFKITKECQCGINSTGSGYCPYSIHDFHRTRFDKVKEIKKEVLASGKESSHTLHRTRYLSKEKEYCTNIYSNSAFSDLNGTEKSLDCLDSVIGKGVCEKVNVDKDEEGGEETSSDSSSSSSSSSSHLTFFSSLIAFIAFILIA